MADGSVLWRAYQSHSRRCCTEPGFDVASSGEHNLPRLHTESQSQLKGCIRLHHEYSGRSSLTRGGEINVDILIFITVTPCLYSLKNRC